MQLSEKGKTEARATFRDLIFGNSSSKSVGASRLFWSYRIFQYYILLSAVFYLIVHCAH